MCGLFAGLLRFRRAFSPRAGVMIQPKATYISGKAPQHDVGVAESAFALAVLNLVVLGPSGWILANVEYYKSRG